MKLNFWQWLAIVLLILGIAIWIYQARHKTAPTPPTLPNAQIISQ